LEGVLSRLTGTVITGPFAFAAAGIADLLIYAFRSLNGAVRPARSRRAASTISPR
jgi:hypothetical protein